MELKECFSVWDKLNPEDRNLLELSTVKRSLPEKTRLHNGRADCAGLFAVCGGQLRAFIVSEDGREITLYRLFERDICLFSASCIMSNIQFDISIEAEKKTEVLVIPPDVYMDVMQRSAPLANFTSELMSSRFSDVMWLFDQIMWKSFDKRLAEFLINEASIEGGRVLTITHETIGNHMGSPREVVSRMLKYFQDEGLVKLSRGCVEILEPERLYRLTD